MAASTAPVAWSASAARKKRAARPERWVSAVGPSRRRIARSAASSPAAARTVADRAGPVSWGGPTRRAAPEAAAAAEAAKTYGSSRCPSCQAGTAVSAASTAV
ncbi:MULTISPECIES: hypothetical protein [Streptomyces diastaticus group]|uniref:Uncharacterized protein n=1 Tax=Streptomyces gougerotii TaxID=53448 RepID=A0A8H9HDJ2_9ACTN|nr:hypothetical protein [Streptomyces gougerotii]GFH80438.1 hypothetical protein Sgou_51080 [Streptomyces gougerotii]GGU58331.1 hypothetical protein GCM10010227_09350 [Streptomyces gougerotii]